MRDGKFQFVILSVSHARQAGDPSIGLGATAQGEYTVLRVRITNISSRMQTFYDGAQHVYDAAGREFGAATKADIFGNPSQFWLVRINPGNTVTGDIYFDLPPGDRAVRADLHDSIFSGGVTVRL